jgi:hypothetical protein
MRMASGAAEASERSSERCAVEVVANLGWLSSWTGQTFAATLLRRLALHRIGAF